MRKKYFNNPFATLLTILLICTTGLFFTNSCRKIDYQTKRTNESEERFFNGHKSGEPLVLSITHFMKRQNDKYGFVGKTVKQIGYPFWDKAIIVSEPASDQIGESDSTNITYIPFVRDSQNYVNAALLIKTTPTDTSFKYLCDWQYANADSATTGLNPRNVFHLFAKFDQYVFGRNKFRIIDPELITDDENEMLISMGLSFDSAVVIYNIEPGQNSSGRNSVLVLSTWCDDVYTCINPQLLGFRTTTEIVPYLSCSTGYALHTLLCTST